MPAADHLLDLDLTSLVDPQPADLIVWRTASTEETVLDGGLAAVPSLLSTLDGRESVPWIWLHRPATGAMAQVLGTPALCVVEVGRHAGYRMLARREVPDTSVHRLTPACSYWVRAIRADEAFTTFEAAAHVVLWLQQLVVIPELELRPVYDQGGRRA